MRIAVCTAVWQRHDVTEVFYRWTHHLRAWWAPHDLTVIAAVSEDPAHEALAARYDVDTVDVPNEPLGRKFNAALAVAREQAVEAVLIMGSDDVFDEQTAGAYLPYLETGAYVGLQDFYFYEVKTGRFGYFPGYSREARWLEPVGSGRLMPAAFLDRLDWQLWDPDTHRGMDHSAFSRLKECGIPHPALLNVRALGGIAVSIKTATNLWAFDRINPQIEPSAAAMNRLPGPLGTAIRELVWQG